MAEERTAANDFYHPPKVDGIEPFLSIVKMRDGRLVPRAFPCKPYMAGRVEIEGDEVRLIFPKKYVDLVTQEHLEELLASPP